MQMYTVPRAAPFYVSPGADPALDNQQWRTLLTGENNWKLTGASGVTRVGVTRCGNCTMATFLVIITTSKLQ